MKKLFTATILLTGLIAVCNNPTQAQDEQLSKKERRELNKQAVYNGIEAQQYTIVVNQATTQRGRNINLTSRYFLSVKPDAIVCDLPYFGQSYSGAGYNNEGGVRFTSEKFIYERKEGKKDGYEITIKPTDAQDIQTIQLFVGPEGFTSVNITFTTRSGMRYSGVMDFEKAKSE